MTELEVWVSIHCCTHRCYQYPDGTPMYGRLVATRTLTAKEVAELFGYKNGVQLFVHEAEQTWGSENGIVTEFFAIPTCDHFEGIRAQQDSLARLFESIRAEARKWFDFEERLPELLIEIPDTLAPVLTHYKPGEKHIILAVHPIFIEIARMLVGKVPWKVLQSKKGLFLIKMPKNSIEIVFDPELDVPIFRFKDCQGQVILTIHLTEGFAMTHVHLHSDVAPAAAGPFEELAQRILLGDDLEAEGPEMAVLMDKVGHG